VTDRVGQVWVLPVGSGDDLFVPCLVLGSEVQLLQTRMSEYRLEKRVPTPVLELLNLLTGEPETWYEHQALEDDRSSATRVL